MPLEDEKRYLLSHPAYIGKMTAPEAKRFLRRITDSHTFNKIALKYIIWENSQPLYENYFCSVTYFTLRSLENFRLKEHIKSQTLLYDGTIFKRAIPRFGIRPPIVRFQTLHLAIKDIETYEMQYVNDLSCWLDCMSLENPALYIDRFSNEYYLDWFLSLLDISFHAYNRFNNVTTLREMCLFVCKHYFNLKHKTINRFVYLPEKIKNEIVKYKYIQ